MSAFVSLVVRIAVLASWGTPSTSGAVAVEPRVESGPPLLVIVERGPGVGVDAGSVRAAIATELGPRVVAPAGDPAPVIAASAPRTDVLLVAMSRDHIVLTLRGAGERELTRAVATPGDRAAQLKVVAWLAGNLARDQLSRLKLAEAEPAASAPPPAPAPAPAVEMSAPPPTEGASLPDAPPATEPPAPGPPAPEVPVETAPAAVDRPGTPAAATVRPDSPPRAEAFPRWTVTLGLGGGLSFGMPWQQPQSAGLPDGGSAVVVVQVHRHFGAWFAGLVADYGPRPYHQIAGALLLGRQRRLGIVRLEGSGGAGVEQFSDVVYPPTPSGLADVVYFDAKARAYARVAFAGAVSLARQLDAVAELVGHVTMTDRFNAGATAATLGLRLTLP